MIYIKPSSSSQAPVGTRTTCRNRSSHGHVRTLLLAWTLVLIAAAGIWWWLKSKPSKPAPVSPRAAYRLLVDPNRTDGMAIRLELQLPRGEGMPGRVTLTRPAGCGDVVVRDPEGGIVPHREDGNQISFAEEQFEQGAAGGAFHLHHGLVRLNFAQHIAFGNLIAGLFFPFDYDAAFDRITLFGHHNWSSHCFAR